MTGGEHHDLVVTGCLLQALSPVGADVDTGAHYIFGIALLPEVDFKYDIRCLGFYIVYTVNQGLIHVKNSDFFLIKGVPGLW